MARKSPYSKDYKIARLCRAIEASLESLEKFRWERSQVVKKAAGNHYGDEGGQGSKTPLRMVNWISQYRTLVARQLVAKNPRVMLSTFEPQARAICSTMERWANDHFEKVYLGETLLRIAYDAIDCVGIAMVALADPGDAADSNYDVPAGQPFIKRIDIEDFVFDNRAKSFRECTFMGHHARVSVDVANDLYRRGKKEKFEGETPSDYNPQGDEKIGIFGRGQHADSDEYEEYVSIWQIYLPKQQVILTLKSGDDGLPIHDDEPLRVQRWVGPPCGPYHILGFTPIPGFPMPKSPAMDLMDLDELLNETIRKLADQAGQQKTFIAVSGSGNEDGDRIRKVEDGDVIELDDPENSKEMRVGGPDQVNFAFALKTMDWLNRQSGNMETMGGLTQSAGTARQEELLNTNASRTVLDMLDTSLTFTQGVMESYLWLHYHHPYNEMKAPYEVEGYPDVSTIRRVTPEQRYNIDWDDIGIKVDPYARPHQTPQQKISFINSIVDRMMAREQLMMSQGVMFDSAYYLDLMAKYGDCAEINGLYGMKAPMNFGPGGPQMQGGSSVPGEEEMGGNSNPSEATPGGEEAALMQKLMGGNAGGDPNSSPSLMATG